MGGIQSHYSEGEGEAEQKIHEAEGYALERINRAKGDPDRFTQTLKAYQQVPDVTRKRLYLETMQQVFPQLKDKLILDQSAQGIVPLLKLNPSERNKGS